MPWLFYCDFTARFLSVENGNYILFGICLSFHATVFFSVQNHIYFIGFLSFHCTIFCICSNCNYIPLVLVCRFTALFCLFNICAVQNCNYVPLTFCRLTARCFFSKLQLYFIWYLFVVSRHGVFFLFKNLCCSKQCKVQ